MEFVTFIDQACLCHVGLGPTILFSSAGICIVEFSKWHWMDLQLLAVLLTWGVDKINS